jgi:hypothetical protein
VTFLAAVPSGFKNGHAFDANFVQRVLYRFELGDLDYRFDLRHFCPFSDSIVRPD